MRGPVIDTVASAASPPTTARRNRLTTPAMRWAHTTTSVRGTRSPGVRCVHWHGILHLSRAGAHTASARRSLYHLQLGMPSRWRTRNAIFMASEDIQQPNFPPMAGLSGGSGQRLSADEFARRFRDSWRVLWCIAAGELGERSAADDVVQQAALIALERLDDFDPSTNFLAWMAQIVRYTAKNEAQKGRRRRTSAADPAVIDASRAGTDTVNDQRHAMPITRLGSLIEGQSVFDDHVLAALRSLDVVARSCLLLRVVLDSPYKEISLVLGIPQGTAMSHVDRARRALREHLMASQARPAGGAAQ